MCIYIEREYVLYIMYVYYVYLDNTIVYIYIIIQYVIEESIYVLFAGAFHGLCPHLVPSRQVTKMAP